MRKSRTLFGKRLCFIIVFSFLGAFNLYAQNDPDTPELNSEERLSVFKKEYESKINSIENDIAWIEKSVKEIKNSLDRLSSSASKSQIWQIVSAVSVALIPLLLIGVVVLLLKRLGFHTAVEDTPKPKADEKFRKEHPLPEESGTVSLGISSIEFNRVKNKVSETESKLSQLTDKVSLSSKEIPYFQRELSSLQAEMADFKQDMKSINDTVSLLKDDIAKNREKLARKEQVENDPVAIFNQWAQNSHLPFPQYFTYVTNIKLEFRTKQDFTDTNIETEWIRNTVGERKYLFPNPNKIDNLSGPIDKLYKVAGTRKAKGTNSVKVISACQIKEGNFIEYQGELLLI